MFGGILKKFGTESYAISGALVAFALDCASKTGAPASTSAATVDVKKRAVMKPPPCKGGACSARWRPNLTRIRTAGGNHDPYCCAACDGRPDGARSGARANAD